MSGLRFTSGLEVGSDTEAELGIGLSLLLATGKLLLKSAGGMGGSGGSGGKALDKLGLLSGSELSGAGGMGGNGAIGGNGSAGGLGDEFGRDAGDGNGSDNCGD